MATRIADFDLIARPYRWLEYLTFGPILERCRFHFLGDLSIHRRALVLGDGDGRFTARLLATNPHIAVDAVDSSAAMLALLTERVARLGPPARERLRTFHRDALALDLAGPYDLVVTHFFLDCLSEVNLNAMMAKIHPELAPGAKWLVSEFAVPPTQPAATLARIVIRALYLGFRMLTGLKTQQLPDYASAFRRNGFSIANRTSFLGGLLVSELWRLNPPA